MSVRCKNFEPGLDLAAYEGLKLRVLGNGLRYKCIIRTDSSWDGIGYCRCDRTGSTEGLASIVDVLGFTQPGDQYM